MQEPAMHGIGYRSSEGFHVAARALAADKLEFKLGALTTAHALMHGLETVPVFRSDQLKHAFADELLGGIGLENATACRIHLQNRAVAAQDLHTVRAMIQKRF